MQKQVFVDRATGKALVINVGGTQPSAFYEVVFEGDFKAVHCFVVGWNEGWKAAQITRA
jgi:hypothetical protein